MQRQIFFNLLHEARRLKNVLGWNRMARRGYLLGMMRVYLLHYDDIKAGQNIRDYWGMRENQNEGV